MLLVAGLALIMSLFLSRLTWIRSGRKNAVIIWEIIRTVAVLLSITILFNPTKVIRKLDSEKPQVVCLIDQSESMETLDSRHAEGKVQTREAWVREKLAEPWRLEIEKNSTFFEKGFCSKDGKGRTNIHDALNNALDEQKNVRAVLVWSDGNSNQGPPVLSLAGKCRSKSIPIFNVSVGSKKTLPDLSLENALIPSFAMVDERISIGYRLKNDFDTLQETHLSLFAGDKLVKRKLLRLPPSVETVGNFLWLPDSEGVFEIKMILDSVENENFLSNNEFRMKTRVERKILNVLLADSEPRWEYRFLRNAMERDPGVELDAILFHPTLKNYETTEHLVSFPETMDKLTKYDVVFLGDVGLEKDGLNKEQCKNLAKLVKNQASGLVLIPGRNGRQLSLAGSELNALMPIIYDPDKPEGLGTKNPCLMELTEKGKLHWLTDLKGVEEPNREFWKNLPGFHWSACVLKSRPGSEVLAVHSNFRTDWGKMPTLALRYVGSGKTLFLGSDSAWRWRRGVEDKYHYRFWSQIVRWMARSRNRAQDQGIRMLYDPEIPKAGETVFLRCLAMDKSGFPIETDRVNCSIFSKDKVKEVLELVPDEECKGVFLGSFKSKESGTFPIKIELIPSGKSLESELVILPKTVEKLGQPTNSKDLTQLAQLTGGKSGDETNWRSVVHHLSFSQQPKPIVRIKRMRADPSWGLLILLMFSVYWIGRKFHGML